MPLGFWGWALATAVGIPLALFKSYPIHAWWLFRRDRKATALPRENARLVSIVVPLCCREEGLRENLESLISQAGLDAFEVLFCVEDAGDSARAVAEDVIAAAPPGRARLVVSGPADGELGKLHNLMAGVRAACGSVLVFVDSDTRLPAAGYLASFVSHLDRPGVGCVTCYPIYRGGRDLGALLLAGMINLDLRGTFVVRAAWGDGAFANGACMALSREALVRCGGLEPLRRRLLMDSRLAEAVERSGLRVVVHRDPVVIERARVSFLDLWTQSSRWHVALYRGLRPWTWLAFGWLRNALPLALAFFLLTPDSMVARGMLFGILWIRASQAVRLPGTSRRPVDLVMRALIQPWADLIAAAAWWAAILQPHVRWRHRRYRVARDGVLTAMEVGTPVPARAARSIPRTGGWRSSRAHRDRGTESGARADVRPAAPA